MEFLQSHPSYAYLVPIFVVIAAGMILLAIDLIIGEKLAPVTGLLAVASLAAAGALCAWPVKTDSSHVTGFITYVMNFDKYARYFSVLFCAASGSVVLLAMSFKPKMRYMGEFYSLIVIITGAFMFLASATNLLMLYLCIEFVGITCYVLAAYLKGDPRSGEGAIKYLLSGGVAAAFMVYGMSLLYGFTGSLDIATIGAALAKGVASQKAVFLAFALVLIGFGFKIAMVPFHMWAPDAYEGSPTPVTAFFSIAPKAAGLAALLRVFLIMFPDSIVHWAVMMSTIASISAFLGNIVAIWQSNIKRMLAYSSIAHIGYVLIGLIVAGTAGLGTEAGNAGLFSSMFYMAAYFVTNIGVFAAVIIFSNAIGSDDMEHYAGLGRRSPFTAACLTFLLLSLAGIPPTAGFIGKFFLFMGAIDAKQFALAIMLAANSVISLYYYWMIVRRMYIEKPKDTTPVAVPLPALIVLIASVLGTLLLGLLFSPLMHFVNHGLL